jgi:hypothetical protein
MMSTARFTVGSIAARISLFLVVEIARIITRRRQTASDAHIQSFYVQAMAYESLSISVANRGKLLPAPA